jgi:hypothetical protein
MNKNNMVNIIEATFESMAFWEPELIKKFPKEELPDKPVICNVCCDKPDKIEFNFICSHETAQQLSDDINQNLFGSSEESIEDCLKEIMNVIGGDYCVQTFPESDFSLTIPKMLTKIEQNGEMLKFECDEGSFYIQFKSDELM